MLYLSADIRSSIEYCTSGKFVCSDGGAVHPARLLSSYVLLYGTDGEYRIDQNGTEYILTPDSFLLLFAGYCHHGTAPCPCGTSHFWCHFTVDPDCRIIDSAQAESQIHANDDEKKLLIPEFGHAANGEKFRLLFHSLIDSSRSSEYCSSEICSLILKQMLCELTDCVYSSESGEKKPNIQQAVASNILEYIHINAVTINSVSDVADHFGYNAEYLTTFIKKQTGQSIIRHINTEKINYAKKLLLETDETISAIATECGYADPKYFSRIFREYTDTTPFEYRHAYYRMHINHK